MIFEVWPAEGEMRLCLDFDLAEAFKNELSAMDGFISIERFQSLAEPGKLLSLSIWRDEEAVRRWSAIKRRRTAARRTTAASPKF